MAHLALFLLYFLWFSVVMLWFVALSDIGSHARKGAFTTAALASMAVAVLAVRTIFTANAVVRHGWIEAAPKAIAGAPTPRTFCMEPPCARVFPAGGR